MLLLQLLLMVQEGLPHLGLLHLHGLLLCRHDQCHHFACLKVCRLLGYMSGVAKLRLEAVVLLPGGRKDLSLCSIWAATTFVACCFNNSLS